MLSEVVGWPIEGRTDRRHHARPEPTSRSSRPPDRWHPRAARGHGRRSLRRGWRCSCIPSARSRRSRTWRSSRRSSSTATSLASSPSRASARPTARTSWLGAQSSDSDVQPNQPEPEVKVHFTGTVRLATGRRDRSSRRAARGNGRSAIGRETSIASTSTAPPTRCWSRRGERRARWSACLRPACRRRSSPENRVARRAAACSSSPSRRRACGRSGQRTLNLPSRSTGWSSRRPRRPRRLVAAVVTPGDGERRRRGRRRRRALVALEAHGYRTV